MGLGNGVVLEPCSAERGNAVGPSTASLAVEHRAIGAVIAPLMLDMEILFIEVYSRLVQLEMLTMAKCFGIIWISFVGPAPPRAGSF